MLAALCAGLTPPLRAAAPVRHPANPAKGFQFPYYLFVPPEVEPLTPLVVEPNNTGRRDDDFAVHDAAASNLINGRITWASDLRAPFLVPAFPRPASLPDVYTHALSRACFTTAEPALQRLDLQLLAMVEDARGALSAQGVTTDTRIFLLGFSASGMFANRLALLHPGRIKAAAVGAPGGWPTVPAAAWAGETLDYHVGIADVGALTGTPFDPAAYRAVPHYFFIGDQDTNDSIPPGDNQVNRLFGTTPVARWPAAEAIYADAGCTNSRFVTYAGVGHTFTEQMALDVKRFFKPHLRVLSQGIRAELALSRPADGYRLEWSSLAGITYHVDCSSNLTAWTPADAPPRLGDGCLQWQPVDPPARGAAFYRLRAAYIPPHGTPGRFFHFLPAYGASRFTVVCDGWEEGPCSTSVAGGGTFVHQETGDGASRLVVTLEAGGTLTLEMLPSGHGHGAFTGAYVNGDIVRPFGGAYEALHAP